MKRLSVVLSVIIIFIQMIFAGEEVSGIEPKKIYTTETIIIKDTKWKNVEVITKKEIEKSNFQTVSEVLSSIPGVYFSIGMKGETSIYIRGVSKSKVKVLIDGVSVNDIYYDTIDVSVISIESIEQIEVYKGLSASSYGSNTMGGVVNIVTSSPQSPISVLVQGDNFNGGKLSGTFSFSKGIFTLSGGFSEVYGDGYKLSNDFAADINEDGSTRENSAFSKKNLILKNGLDFDANNFLHFGATIIDNYKELPYNISATKSKPSKVFKSPRYWRFPIWKEKIFTIDGQKLINDLMKFSLKTNYIKIDNTLDMAVDSEFEEMGEEDTFDDSGLNINTALEGMKYLKYKIGYNYEEKHHNKTEKNYIYDEIINETMSSAYNNFFLSLEKRFSSFLINLQTSYNGYEANDFKMNKMIYISKLEAELVKKLTIQTQFGTKIHFPTLKQMNDIIADNLKPEESTEFNINLNYRTGIIDLTLGYFSNSIDNLINRDKKGEPYYNIGKSLISGGEVTVKLKYWRFSLTSNGELISGVNKSETGSPDDYIDDLPYIPEYRLYNSLNINILKSLDIALEANFIGKTYEYTYDPSSHSNIKTEIPSYDLMNINANFRINKMFKLYARVNNLFDTNYYTETDFPCPGRQIILGVRME